MASPFRLTKQEHRKNIDATKLTPCLSKPLTRINVVMPSMPAQYTEQIPWPHTVGGVSFWMVNNIAEDSQGRIYIVHRGHVLWRALIKRDISKIDW